jgi:hypothetical protein
VSSDIRAALERLVELEDAKGPAPAIANAWTDAIAAARVLLATKPVGEGPSDEELYELWGLEGHEGDFQDCRRFYRAARARWGTPAAPPAPEPGGVEA